MGEWDERRTFKSRGEVEVGVGKKGEQVGRQATGRNGRSPYEDQCLSESRGSGRTGTRTWN